MINKIAYTDIGAVVATCQAEEGVAVGKVVKMSADCTVAPCQSGEKFCGVAMQCRNGLAAVQFKGFVTVNCAEGVTLGWNTVAADGSGGITTASNGIPVLVVAKHGDGSADICL